MALIAPPQGGTLKRLILLALRFVTVHSHLSFFLLALLLWQRDERHVQLDQGAVCGHGGAEVRLLRVEGDIADDEATTLLRLSELFVLLVGGGDGGSSSLAMSAAKS